MNFRKPCIRSEHRISYSQVHEVGGSGVNPQTIAGDNTIVSDTHADSDIVLKLIINIVCERITKGIDVLRVCGVSYLRFVVRAV